MDGTGLKLSAAFLVPWPQSRVLSPRVLPITFCPILLRIQGRVRSGLEKHLSDPLERERQSNVFLGRSVEAKALSRQAFLLPANPRDTYLPLGCSLGPICSPRQGLRLILQPPLTPKAPLSTFSQHRLRAEVLIRRCHSCDPVSSRGARGRISPFYR